MKVKYGISTRFVIPKKKSRMNPRIRIVHGNLVAKVR